MNDRSTPGALSWQRGGEAQRERFVGANVVMDDHPPTFV
jgi:hypothetical protein